MKKGGLSPRCFPWLPVIASLVTLPGFAQDQDGPASESPTSAPAPAAASEPASAPAPQRGPLPPAILSDPPAPKPPSPSDDAGPDGEKPPAEPSKPAPGPYAISAIPLPADLTGRVASVDFAPDGRWLLLTDTGEIRIREGAGDPTPTWHSVSDSGLEGASGLFAGYWPRSLMVVHGAGISRLFDTDDDGRIDFVKATIPVWRFGTSGVLFAGTPAVLPSGDLLASPRVLTGPWSGAILQLPEASPASTWLAGYHRVAAPARGPGGAWLVAGIPALPPREGDSPSDPSPSPFATLRVIPPEAAAETETAPDPSGQPDTGKKPEKSEPSKSSELSEPAEPAEPKSAALPPPALWIPSALMPTAPITPAFPPVATAGEFGFFTGQGFLAGETSQRLLRFFLEPVDGVWQGMVTDFAAIESPLPGLGFLRFVDDGTELLAGQNGQLLSIRPDGGGIFSAKTVRLAVDGFEVTFTAPVHRQTATDPAAWKISALQPATTGAAESPFPLDPALSRLIISADGHTVAVQTADLKPGTTYRIDLSAIPSETGSPISHGPVWYTVNRLPPLPDPPPAPPETENPSVIESATPEETHDGPPILPAPPAKPDSAPPVEPEKPSGSD